MNPDSKILFIVFVACLALSSCSSTGKGGSLVPLYAKDGKNPVAAVNPAHLAQNPPGSLPVLRSPSKWGDTGMFALRVGLRVLAIGLEDRENNLAR